MSAEFKRWKASRQFNRVVNDFVQFVNFQSSIFNDPNKAEFTVNLGVAILNVQDRLDDSTAQGALDGAEQVWGCRLEEINVNRYDEWFEVTPESNPEPIGREIAQVLKTVGLPMLERASDRKFLLRRFEASEDNRNLYEARRSCPLFPGFFPKIDSFAGARHFFLLGEKRKALQILKKLKDDELKKNTKSKWFVHEIEALEQLCRLDENGQ